MFFLQSDVLKKATTLINHTAIIPVHQKNSTIFFDIQKERLKNS